MKGLIEEESQNQKLEWSKLHNFENQWWICNK
jgi:hypothetical protein